MTAPTLALLAALAPAEGMAGAACTGLAPLHDSEVDSESGEDREARHAHAKAICAGCRVLEVCRASLDTLPPQTVGVWAGVVLTGKGHREPLRQCSIDGCPYVTRDPSRLCPLHRSDKDVSDD